MPEELTLRFASNTDDDLVEKNRARRTTGSINKSTTLQRIRPTGCASDQKRRTALRLFETGFGYKSVAQILSLSPYTVRDWMRAFRAGRFTTRLSPKQYRYPEEIKTRVVELRASGLSWKEIEEATGVKRSTCRSWLRTKQN